MDVAELERRLREGTNRTETRSDFDLNPGMKPIRDTIIEAAVLIPIIAHSDGPSVLMTVRTHQLKDHAGQVAFPGGRRDPGDVSPEATALRETEEEVAIPRTAIRSIGRLAPYNTRTGYRVIPIVGIIEPPIAPRPEPTEVEEIFEVPLKFLLDRQNHQRHSHDVAGTSREFYAMPYGRFYIWGATAGMIVSLADTLDLERR